MAPLVGYDSSDDDSGNEVPQTETPAQANEAIQNEEAAQPVKESPEVRSEQPSPLSEQPRPPPQGPSLPEDAASIGPSLPAADDVDAQAYPEDMDQGLDDVQPNQPAPSSPYTTNRGLIHNLTLPTVPNLDIPPSPPGSPSSASSRTALTAKFDKFLELKRDRGVHFNARLADSHALKNPPLMDKLLGFAGVGTAFEDGSAADGARQYATTLPTDLWDPACFPAWAYRGQLRKAQEKVQKERGRERGEAVHFVPATS